VFVPALLEQTEKVERWKLLLNDAVEIDT
jgi:hypothetical protein